jgi:hypothetical protein
MMLESDAQRRSIGTNHPLLQHRTVVPTPLRAHKQFQGATSRSTNKHTHGGGGWGGMRHATHNMQRRHAPILLPRIDGSADLCSILAYNSPMTCAQTEPCGQHAACTCNVHHAARTSVHHAACTMPRRLSCARCCVSRGTLHATCCAACQVSRATGLLGSARKQPTATCEAQPSGVL